MPDVGYWQTFFLHVASGIPTAAVVATLALLSKSLVGNLFQKDLAHYKSELDRDLQGHLLELKRVHDAGLAELQVRFARLHERRFDCVAGVYSTLLAMLWSLERVSNPGAPPDEGFRREQLDKFNEALGQMNSTFNVNRILLPKSLAEEVRAVALSMAGLADRIGINPDTAYDQFFKLAETVKPRLEHLTDEFRVLLGVELVGRDPGQFRG